MRFLPLLCAFAFALTPATLPAQAPAAAADPLERPASAALAEAMALPMAGNLIGARDVPRFAWVETRAGVRNIWVADHGKPARRITNGTRDDGELLYGLALSADGSRIAYVRGGDGDWTDDAAPNAGELPVPTGRNLYVKALDADTPAQRVSGGHIPVFSPDGARIAFANGKEILVWDGREAKGGEPKRVARVDGTVERLAWSPDGKSLVFVDNRDTHSFIGLLDLEPARLRYLDPTPDFAVEPVFSPDGRQIAFIRYLDPPSGAPDDAGPYWSIQIADVATGKARTLWKAPKGVGGRYYGTRSKNLFWSAEGSIVFPWERSGWIHPYAIDAKGGQPRELTPGAFEVESYLLDADGRSLIVAGNSGDIDRRHLWRVDLRQGAPVKLTSGTGIESYPTLGGKSLALIASNVESPAYPAIADGELTPLGERASLKSFVKPEAVTFKAADGVTVHAQLFRAQGVKGKRPALVFIHGGPRRQMLLGFVPSSYYANTYILNQHFALAGYDVLQVNYRSGTGYGLAFRDAAETGREGASEYRDILAAGKWLAAQPQVDPARIGVWGGSWGGYLTALALGRDSALFASGVDVHGVHAMVRNLPGNVSPKAQEAARQIQWDSSPMAALDTWRSPVLLIHGDDDRNVGFVQTTLLARELAARGIPHRSIAYPNERHTFLRYDRWLAAFAATDAFFEHTLKRKAPLP